jgi:hypothetical protein
MIRASVQSAQSRSCETKRIGNAGSGWSPFFVEILSCVNAFAHPAPDGSSCR